MLAFLTLAELQLLIKYEVACQSLLVKELTYTIQTLERDKQVIRKVLGWVINNPGGEVTDYIEKIVARENTVSTFHDLSNHFYTTWFYMTTENEQIVSCILDGGELYGLDIEHMEMLVDRNPSIGAFRRRLTLYTDAMSRVRKM